MTADEVLAALQAMTPEQREQVQAAMTGTREVLGLRFRHYTPGCWLCEDCEHNVLITQYGAEYEVHVHEKMSIAAVLAGPFHSARFDCCVAWAKGRCGLLPDQIEQLKQLTDAQLKLLGFQRI